MLTFTDYQQELVP